MLIYCLIQQGFFPRLFISFLFICTNYGAKCVHQTFGYVFSQELSSRPVAAEEIAGWGARLRHLAAKPFFIVKKILVVQKKLICIFSRLPGLVVWASPLGLILVDTGKTRRGVVVAEGLVGEVRRGLVRDPEVFFWECKTINIILVHAFNYIYLVS